MNQQRVELYARMFMQSHVEAFVLCTKRKRYFESVVFRCFGAKQIIAFKTLMVERTMCVVGFDFFFRFNFSHKKCVHL